jgi:hypothetical protein
MACSARAGGNVDFQVFLVADEPLRADMETKLQRREVKQGDVTVFSSRAKTGFSGMITVSVVLLAMQILTGVRAFPL